MARPNGRSGTCRASTGRPTLPTANTLPSRNWCLNGCGQVTGQFYEADHWRGDAGDGFYDIDTLGSIKYDYALFNNQRFYADHGGGVGGSYVSDHDVLRAAMTVHD